MRARVNRLGAVLMAAWLGIAVCGRARADQLASLDAAISWLETLKSGNAGALESKTASLFVQAGLECAKSPASTPSARAALLGCIVEANPLFSESIPTAADARAYLADWRSMTRAQLPRRLAQKVPAGAQLVGGSLDGNGISFKVALAIEPDGTVAGLFVELADNDAR